MHELQPNLLPLPPSFHGIQYYLMTSLEAEDTSNTAEAIKDEEEIDGTAAVSKTSTTADFKASLERFRHVNSDDKNPSGRSSPKAEIGTTAAIRRSGRKLSPETTQPNPEPAETPSPSSKKRKRQSSRYAPPSKYAHLSKLTDVLEPNLICVFIGFNPGVRTATSGHAYAHPSNLFWKLLHSSGCTDERLKPEQDVDLPRLYSMGNTNIVDRPSKDAGELSKAEMAAGTPILEEKIRTFRPEAVCIVGKGIWEAIWRWRYGRAIRKEQFRYGWQEEKERMGKTEDWEGAVIFVATATSGLAASLKPAEKEAIWRPFGQWVKRRREERRADQGDGKDDRPTQT